MRLRSKTSPEWLETVLGDFDRFLVDHALCERKASALAMSLVAHYPDKKDLVSAMIDLAIEELDHFKQVFALIVERDLFLGADEKDDYVNRLRRFIRKSSDEYFLDRLLIASIIECRGTERFQLVAQGLSDPRLKEFYMEFWRAEARHAGLFLRFAKKYFPADVVEERYDYLLDQEAVIVESLPLRAAVH
ncbi:MAG: tRNA-(ms[2]io[6]A)-hydroxylase [Myxococcales bacterium]|nr:tRNA-(ms[2]io[6]A)-hydroxylase [Myxococcales bacterium]USN49829.1 MAG: tRNA-(ms[2]io[6]A)-hydroxylase [Myxococcales bacterium]